MFSGYGGLSMAVEQVTGGMTAWFVENDKDPAAILAHHWPTVPNLGDVTTVDWTTVEPVDVVCAGFPCQDLSYAGKGRGITEGTRSGLWYSVADALGVLRPRLVVLENVAAIVGRRPGLDVVLGSLAEIGFDAEWLCVRAADVGAPHGRDRWFLVAYPAGVGWGEGWPESAGRLGGSAVVVGGASAPDAGCEGRRTEGFTAPRRAQGWWASGEPQRRGGAPSPDGDGHGPGSDAGGVGRLARGDAGTPRERERSRTLAGDRGAAAAAYPHRDGCARLAGLPTGRDAVHGDSGSDADRRGPVVEWGAYGPAIARWERVLGRRAPRPTEPGRSGERLSPRFVEWMQGLPEGHVTDVPGLSRNAQLKALGNGVVPQQAALALSTLLTLEAAA